MRVLRQFERCGYAHLSKHHPCALDAGWREIVSLGVAEEIVRGGSPWMLIATYLFGHLGRKPRELANVRFGR